MWTEGTCHVRSDPGGGSSYLQRFQNEPALQDANQRALECSRVLVDKLLAETRKYDAIFSRPPIATRLNPANLHIEGGTCAPSCGAPIRPTLADVSG